jgi:hypothetical protein
MIYKTFKQWKDGNYLEDLEPRKEAYTQDELLLIEMGWNYGFDAGVEAGRWVGLTEAERIDIIDEEITAQSTEHFALAQAIEAKLGEEHVTDRELMRRTWEFFSRYILVNEMAQESLDAEAKTILEALRARLAQPEQEPVAGRFKIGEANDYLVSVKKPGLIYDDGNGGTRVDNGEPLYTAPPQREWQGLTDEEIMDACSSVWASNPIEVGRIIQDLLKARNT